MKSPEGQEYKTIPVANRAFRVFTDFVTKPFFKVKVTNPDGLSRARELAKQGYGNLFVGNHLSLGDPPREIITITNDPVLQDREMLTPFGIQQIKFGYRTLARMMGITICPLVNDDTLKYIAEHPKKAPKFQHALTKEGSAELLSGYLIKQTPRVLREGGSVLLYPQGGRRSYLENLSNAFSTLINRTTRYGVDKFAITFMGIGMKDTETYEDETIKGLNIGSCYELKMEGTLTKEDFIKEAKQRGLTLDQLALEKLGLVVPPAYRPRNLALLH